MTTGQKLRLIGAVMIIVGFVMLLTSSFGGVSLVLSFVTFIVTGFCFIEDLF